MAVVDQLAKHSVAKMGTVALRGGLRLLIQEQPRTSRYWLPLLPHRDGEFHVRVGAV